MTSSLECHLEKKKKCLRLEGGAENKRHYSRPGPCEFVDPIICMIYLCLSKGRGEKKTNKHNICYSISEVRPAWRLRGNREWLIDGSAKRAARHVQSQLASSSLRQERHSNAAISSFLCTDATQYFFIYLVYF